jgi:hypothetical protein
MLEYASSNIFALCKAYATTAPAGIGLDGDEA